VTPAEALDSVMRGVGHDLRDYHVLRSLLEAQFHAALRHEATPLATLAERITELVDGLERRRIERVALVEALVGPGARMTTLIARVGGARRQRLASGWEALEAAVGDCKALNARNCRLMTDQHDIMQRVLHGEDQTYAPA
jgi:flagella synthesis protein FlgN